jgi:hypothetical protein
VFEVLWVFTVEQTVARVEVRAEKASKDIVAYMEKELSEEIMESLLKYGFSFDVAL